MNVGSHLGVVATALALAVAAPPVAVAQMQLPGAVGSSASGAPPRETGNAGSVDAPRAPPKPIVVKPPNDATILGHPLAHDGAAGAMTFDRVGADLVLTKLSLTGDRLSSPTKTCGFDVAIATPIVATSAGRPAGALRYSVPLAACPFSIDILDGAVLVSTSAPTCDFAAADCRVALAGLWGPAPSEISDKRVKELERERVRIETTMRANFRVLLKRAGKDRAAVKAIAADQAAFSSSREMACRDYAKESEHGFCSTQMTEARVLALLAKFGDEADKADKAPERKRLARERVKSRPGPAGSNEAPGSARQ